MAIFQKHLMHYAQTTSRGGFLRLFSFVALFALVGQLGYVPLTSAASDPGSFALWSFDLTDDASFSVDEDGNQSGAGVIMDNGNAAGFPEGSCLPAMIEVTHNETVPTTLEVTIEFDYLKHDVYGILDLESLTTALHPTAITDLSDYVYDPGSNITSLTEVPVEDASGVMSTVAVEVTGPTSSSGGGGTKHSYTISLEDVPADSTAYVMFCGRLSDEAGAFGGADMAIKLGGGGAENIPIPANALLELPEITVIKQVINDDGRTSSASDFTMNVEGTNVSLSSFPGSDGTTVTMDPGAYAVTEEVDPNYTAMYSVDCTGTLDYDETATCTVTNDDEPLPTTATLTVIKQVVNDNGGTGTASDFTMDVSVLDADMTSVVPVPGSETGETLVLENGMVFSVEERAANGYTASYAGDCDGTVVAGESYTCTITNDDIPAQLTVIKEVVGTDTPASNFSLSVSGSIIAEDGDLLTQDTFLGSTDGYDLSLNAGDFLVSEAPVLNYETSYAGDCSGAAEIGTSYVCTVTNTYVEPELPPVPAELTVVKTVVNNDGGDSTADDVTFEIFDAEGTSVASFAGDAAGTSVSLPAGTYTIEETAPSGYTADWSGCAGGTVTLAEGETAVCTVVNNDQPATLNVIVVVENDDDGTATADMFDIQVAAIDATLNSFPGNSDGTSVTMDAGEYTAMPADQDFDGYSFSSSEACEGTIGLGETRTCVITFNDPEPEPEDPGGGGGSEEPPTPPGTLRVSVVIINDQGGDLDVSQVELSVLAADGTETVIEEGVATVFPAGSYTVLATRPDSDETWAPYYTQAFIAGPSQDCTTDGVATVVDGGAESCVVTLEDYSAFVNVETQVVGGTLSPQDFSLVVNSASSSLVDATVGVESDATNTVYLFPGSYTIVSSVQPNYTTAYTGACTGDIPYNTFSATCLIVHTFVDETDEEEPPVEEEEPDPTPVDDEDEDRGGGGGGCGTCGTRPSTPDTSSEPTTPPAPIVLGETDEVTVEPTTPPVVVPTLPDPRVLGETDELPITGMPVAALAFLAAPLLWAVRKRK